MSELVISLPSSARLAPATDRVPDRPAVTVRTATTTSPSVPTYTVDVVTDRAGLESHRVAWDMLSSRAAEPNVFYEPWMLLPAIDAFGGSTSFRIAFIYRSQPGSLAPRELCGFFPFEIIRRSAWTGTTVLRLWRHQHCFLGTPLIHQDHVAAVWHTVLNWASASRPTPWWLDLSHQSAEGPLWPALLEVARQREQTIYPVEPFHRAVLHRAEKFDRYCQQAMSAHFRQELRRKRRRLGELGDLELRVLEETDRIDEWIEHFLQVEALGWKGRESSALASSADQRTFFESMACGAFARKKLHLMGLFLDGRPIAMKCNLLTAPGAFSFKIGFDESLSKFSPGVLLEWDNTRWLHEQTEIHWMDSCAKPGHFMIGQLWKDRRLLHRLLIPTCRRGELALAMRPLLHAVRRLHRQSGAPVAALPSKETP